MFEMEITESARVVDEIEFREYASTFVESTQNPLVQEKRVPEKNKILSSPQGISF